MSAEQRRRRDVATLETYFHLLERKDLDAWIGLWAEDCAMAVPYAAGALPRELGGRADIKTLYQNIADGYDEVRFTFTEFLPTYEPGRVFARWRPECRLAGGETFGGESAGIFEFTDEGLIKKFTEYFDPTGFDDVFDVSVQG